MTDPWRLIDALGYRIARWWTPRLQTRTGVLLTIAGLLLVPYVLFAGEPPLIYLMSAFALVLGGLGVMVTAVLAVNEDPDSSTEDLRPDE